MSEQLFKTANSLRKKWVRVTTESPDATLKMSYQGACVGVFTVAECRYHPYIVRAERYDPAAGQYLELFKGAHAKRTQIPFSIIKSIEAVQP